MSEKSVVERLADMMYGDSEMDEVDESIQHQIALVMVKKEKAILKKIENGEELTSYESEIFETMISSMRETLIIIQALGIDKLEDGTRRRLAPFFREYLNVIGLGEKE